MRALCFAVLALAGCDGCKRTPPVVGFSSDAAPMNVASADAASDARADVAHFAAVDGRPVTGHSLTVDGATLDPPDGTSFGQWLPVDLDGDGESTDVAATLAGSDHTARPLALYRRDTTGFTSLPFADATPGDARCADASLRLTSAHSIAVSWRCPTTAAAGAPLAHTDEEVLVLLGPTPRVRERASLKAPLPSDVAVTLALEGADRDGDGVDEVVVSVLVGAAGQRPRSSVRAVYFERSGGLARDTSEPAASFGALIERARRAISARRRGSTGAVLSTLDDVSRLRRVACNGSPSARLELHGAAMPCESVVFSSASEVMARALMAGGELPAAWALARAATASEFGVVTSPRVLSELRRASTPERGAVGRRGPSIGGASPEGRLGARLSMLVFEPLAGPTALSVRGVASGRVDLATMTYLGGEGGSLAELMARSPDGTQAIAGFADTCAGLAMARCDPNAPGCVALAQRPAGGALGDEATRVPLGGAVAASLALRCLTDPQASVWLGPTPRAAVLSWGASGLVVSLNGRLASVAGDAATFGADAVGAALASPEGVWIRDRTGWKLLSPPELTGRFNELTDLTVSADGRMVAGMIDQEVWVIERARPTNR